jgi:hypothetical protein
MRRDDHGIDHEQVERIRGYRYDAIWMDEIAVFSQKPVEATDGREDDDAGN